MSDSAEQPNLLGKLRTQINEKIGYLLDNNSRATIVLRGQAKNFEALAMFYEDQRMRCLDVAEDVAMLARISSEMTGDLISAEFGLDYPDEDTDDDDNNHINSEV